MELMPPMNEVFGWAAAGLTLLAFSCNDIVRLRYTALIANAAFIAYGLTAQLWPVLALHAVLVPVNLWRLWEVIRPPAVPEEGKPAVLSEAVVARPVEHA